MKESRLYRRLVPLTIAVLVIIRFTACGHRAIEVDDFPPPPPAKLPAEGDNDIGTSPPASLEGPFESPTRVAYPRPRATPVLPASADNITETQLRQYLGKLYYDILPANSELTLAECMKANNPCNNGSTAMVYIEPEVGVKWRGNPKNANGNPLFEDIPKEGVVVARIINYSPPPGEETRFGFPARSHTWWVVDSANGGLRSRFFVRDYGNEAKPWHPIRGRNPDGTVGSTEYVYRDCQHEAPPNRPSIAKWANCDDSRVYMYRFVARPRSNESPLASYIHAVAWHPSETATVFGVALDSSWITCPQGCCASS